LAGERSRVIDLGQDVSQVATNESLPLVARGELPTRRRRTALFVRHYLEMCLPMCVGFGVGDVIYLWAADGFGYSEPFSELPELSVAVVTFSMTAPMAAWMRFRRMPTHAIAEMSAVMPILATVLLGLGWAEVLEKGNLVLLEHGAMMPAMLVPMLLHLELYTGGHRHGVRLVGR
jgi:hypothetical protein